MRRIITTFSAALLLLITGVVAGYAAGGTGVVEAPPKTAFLASGQNPADALAAGPIAGRLGAPMYTTPKSSLSSDASDGLVAYAPKLIIVLGGPGAIEDSVVNELAIATGLSLIDPATLDEDSEGIVRVAGDTRYSTAAAVAALIDTLRPGFLPVGATAQGALTADTATTATTADDAALLAGLAASEIPGQSFAAFAGISVTGEDATDTVNVGSVTVTAPADGYVIVTFDGHAYVDALDLVILAASDRSANWSANDGNISIDGRKLDQQSFSHTRRYDVTAGEHTFYAVADKFVGGGDGEVGIYGSLTVTYFPN